MREKNIAFARSKEPAVWTIEIEEGFQAPNWERGIPGQSHVYFCGLSGIEIAIEKAWGLDSGPDTDLDFDFDEAIYMRLPCLRGPKHLTKN